jgi:hypothetical protein
MAPVTLADEGQIIQKINDLLQKIEKTANEIVDGINGWLSKLPGFLTGGIRSATEKFVGLMNEMFSALAEIVTNMGSPATLWNRADAWSSQVGGPISGLSGNADPAQSPALQCWTGAAAEAYKETLGPQRKAIDAIKAIFTDPISSALSAVARAIWVFWGALIAGFAALVVALIGALASTATIVGLPAAPFIAAGGALIFIGAFFAAGEVLRSQCSDSNTTLVGKLNDNTAFRGGLWPVATAGALTDGSLTDGDGTDWHMK